MVRPVSQQRFGLGFGPEPAPGADGPPGGGPPIPTAVKAEGPAPALFAAAAAAAAAAAEPYGVTAAAHGEPERAPGGTVDVTMPVAPGTVNGNGTLVGKPAAAAATAAVSVGPGPEPAPAMPRLDAFASCGNAGRGVDV